MESFTAQNIAKSLHDLQEENENLRLRLSQAEEALETSKKGSNVASNEHLEEIVLQQVEELKRRNNELRESEKKFRLLANSIPQLAWMANPDGYIFWYNQRWYDYTGTSFEEMEGWGWQIVHHPETLPGVLRKWKESLAKGKPFEMMFPLLGKDGRYRQFLTRGLPVFNSERKLVQWLGTNTDISELEIAEKKLEEVQRKLNIALDNGDIGIWERDLHTNRLFWDGRMEKMFGFKEGTFDNTYETFEKCLVEEDVPHFREAVRKAFEEGVPFETVYRIRLPNGKINYINSKGLVTKDKQGNPLRFSGVCYDITDMKKGAENVLFRLNDELLRSNKELEQFAFITSHDLQEPLRTVSNFTQLLAQKYEEILDEEAQTFIRFAVDGTKRMQKLITDLLNYSRVGARSKKFSPVDLNPVLQKAVSNLAVTIQEKKALITNERLPALEGDKWQLIQLFQNLIENSLKFCKREPRIHISVNEESDHYLISVKDNGIGIDQDFYDRVFLIFQRIDTSEENTGTGIGLAICKRIIERHGGRIYFESQLGKGTTFYFTLLKSHALI
jgi:PAS domain S-box-containing protein